MVCLGQVELAELRSYTKSDSGPAVCPKGPLARMKQPVLQQVLPLHGINAQNIAGARSLHFSGSCKRKHPLRDAKHRIP